MFDTASVQFFLPGVNAGNANAYQFRVTTYPGNKVLVPWKTIHSFTSPTQMRQSGLPQMAYLGGYCTALGTMLIMDVKHVKSDRIIATALVAREVIRPEIISIYTSETLDAFLQHLQAPWMPDKQAASNFRTGFTMPSSNTNLVFAMQDGEFNRKQIQYKLSRNGQLYTNWRDNDYDNSFIWLKNFRPGDYVISIRYTAQPQHVTEYSFHITPLWYETVYFRVLTGFLAIILAGLLVLAAWQRRKIEQGEMNRSRLSLELKSIYAQLNPHFVFNALSSIQGLINKEDIRGANTYLTDFAQLTRDSLVHSQKDEVALCEEIRTLDTYLKLEKLRFGFHYQVRVAPDVDIYDTEIPALLLQPLVENAVKHGVAALRDKGMIELSIIRSGFAMIVILTDNGKGMFQENPAGGLGLKLTRDRIRLLNQLHPRPAHFPAYRQCTSGWCASFAHF
ncbi:sensor histidine kinase [Dyadobacter sandarakinus]|uniref:Histidine kinase n=1 Tax=Dyadobacter sandarakinus TaxID=2747268 RepID=A0ABX7I2A6_9BACT|nr:histidine kinase [Dyadobacter sandarakinus]QRR00199.1 histidine kinase [Dyadobacter sandarakinus]